MTVRAWTLICLAVAAALVWCWYRFLGGSGDTEEAAEWLTARASYLQDKRRLSRQVRKLLQEKKSQTEIRKDESDE